LRTCGWGGIAKSFLILFVHGLWLRVKRAGACSSSLARAPAVGYKAERSTTDPKKIAAHHKGSITPLNELTQIIFLKRV
jgi:hypothetical protein